MTKKINGELYELKQGKVTCEGCAFSGDAEGCGKAGHGCAAMRYGYWALLGSVNNNGMSENAHGGKGMKKQLTKEEFLAYLDTIPEETFASLPGAASFVKKEAIKTARESFGTKTADTFKEALNRGFTWRETPQKSDFWYGLYETIPRALGIEEKVKSFDTPYISDPDDPRAASLIGKKVIYADYEDRIMDDTRDTAFLTDIRDRSAPHQDGMFFGISVSMSGRSSTHFRFIREAPETTVEVTMEEVCKQFGKNVKIKKA